jgi:histidine triad (HIT) family protein
MYDENNVFAKILRGELGCRKVYEDDQVLAFHDAFPEAPVHVLVITKCQSRDYSDFVSNSSAEKIGNFFSKIEHVIKLLNLKSYRLITNNGGESGQSVFHFHVHILAGKKISNLL